MRITVHSTLHDLSTDCIAIAKKAPREFMGVVREGIRTGNTVAKDFARESAGSHGKHYPRSFSTEMHEAAGFFYSGEYGPDSSLPQGGMSFEWGSRKQPPHLDLNRSADLIGPSFAQEVGGAVDRLFW